jgi:AAA domain
MMSDYTELSVLFDEDRLPPGQLPIVTAAVKQCQTVIELLVRSRQLTGYSTMAVITGWSGVGKTIAIQACINQLVGKTLVGLPACIQIKVKPGSTPRQLVEDVFTCFGEKPRSLSTNRYKLADAAAAAILSNDLKVLFVDDADQLTTDCFELLRYIYAKTGCPIVVVGLRQIVRIIDQHEKFHGRVGLRLDFPAPYGRRGPLHHSATIRDALLVLRPNTGGRLCAGQAVMGKCEALVAESARGYSVCQYPGGSGWNNADHIGPAQTELSVSPHSKEAWSPGIGCRGIGS